MEQKVKKFYYFMFVFIPLNFFCLNVNDVVANSDDTIKSFANSYINGYDNDQRQQLSDLLEHLITIFTKNNAYSLLVKILMFGFHANDRTISADTFHQIPTIFPNESRSSRPMHQISIDLQIHCLDFLDIGGFIVFRTRVVF